VTQSLTTGVRDQVGLDADHREHEGALLGIGKHTQWIVQVSASTADRSAQAIATAGQPPALLLPAHRQGPLQLLQHQRLIRLPRQDRLDDVGRSSAGRRIRLT